MADFDFSQFTQQVLKLSPDLTKFAKADLPHSYYETILKSYQIVPRDYKSSHQHPFLVFIEEYTFNNFYVGDLEFLERVEEHPKYFVIGSYDAQEIIHDKSDGQIKWKELEIDFILELCASNYMCFLNALLEGKRYLTECLLDEQLAQNQVQQCRISEICSVKAGGKTYKNFYSNLFGCWS